MKLKEIINKEIKKLLTEATEFNLGSGTVNYFRPFQDLKMTYQNSIFSEFKHLKKTNKDDYKRVLTIFQDFLKDESKIYEKEIETIKQSLQLYFDNKTSYLATKLQNKLNEK